MTKIKRWFVVYKIIVKRPFIYQPTILFINRIFSEIIQQSYFFRTFSWSNIMSCRFYWKRTRLLSFKRPLHGLWLSIKCRNMTESILLFWIVRREFHSKVIIFFEFLELFAITFVVNNLQLISFFAISLESTLNPEQNFQNNCGSTSLSNLPPGIVSRLLSLDRCYYNKQKKKYVIFEILRKNGLKLDLNIVYVVKKIIVFCMKSAH